MNGERQVADFEMVNGEPVAYTTQNYKLLAELMRVTKELADLRRLVSLLCPRCGGLSWEVPLEDYCKCDTGREKPTAP